MSKFKKGDTVVMHSCGEAKHEKGRIWVCSDDSFISPADYEAVFLVGYSGFFVGEYLQKVDITTVNTWVSVDERLPSESGACLCWIGFVYLCEFIDGSFYDYKNGLKIQDKIVTHWQPLPKRPKGE